VEMTPYDLSNARLIYRHKAEGGGGAPGQRRPAYRPRR
jgi:hypothetical protein